GFGKAWVANTNAGTVSRIDPARDLVVTTDVGDSPTALAVTGAGVWVADRRGQTVALLDPDSNRVVRQRALGAEPATLPALGSSVWVGVHAGPGAHRGGTYTSLDWGDIDFLDPALAYSTTGGYLHSVVYDGLVGYARSGGGIGTQLVPDLAVAVPRASSDL